MPPYKYGNRPILKIKKIYKGQLANETIKLAATDSMCDYYFEIGKEYVIMINEHKGELGTSVCMNNFELPNKEFLKEVKKLSRQK